MKKQEELLFGNFIVFILFLRLVTKCLKKDYAYEHDMDCDADTHCIDVSVGH